MNVHIVQKGDTLWKIARQNGVSFDELKRMNAHLANPDYIVPGMKIFLPDQAAGKKSEMVHPFNDGRPPKSVVLPEKEEVFEMPVVELPKKEVVKEKEVVVPEFTAPVQPSPIPQYQPVQMPHYHAIQYVPITKNFYSVQQSAQVQPAPPPPPAPIPEESPMVEEIVEEHFEPMEMPMMVQPMFTGPMCGCPPMPKCCPPPIFPCHPCMQPMHHYPTHMFPMQPIATPYFGMQPELTGAMPGVGFEQMMPNMGYGQGMPGMMPTQMVQGAMEEEMSPDFMPEMMGNYPNDLPTMETPEMAGHMGGQMAVNPAQAGWVLESSSDEPSSFLEKFEQQYQQQAPGQVAGAFSPQTAPMYPGYYDFQQPGFQQPGFQQPGYPMAMAPYNYNPYMMPGHFGYGPGPCNCH